MESALLKSCAMIAMLLMSCCCLMGCQERDEIGDLAVVLGTALELEDDGNLRSAWSWRIRPVLMAKTKAWFLRYQLPTGRLQKKNCRQSLIKQFIGGIWY